MNATHASVVTVKPGGTRSGPSTRVISATFAPLPPSSSRMSLDPALKSCTHLCSLMGDAALDLLDGIHLECRSSKPTRVLSVELPDPATDQADASSPHAHLIHAQPYQQRQHQRIGRRLATDLYRDASLMRGGDGARDRAQYARVMGTGLARSEPIAPQRARCQIVGADAEELTAGRDLRGMLDRRRRLDHRAERRRLGEAQ